MQDTGTAAPVEDNDLLLRALGAAVNGVVIADAREPGFPIVYANTGFERITGYAAGEVLGRPCSILQGESSDAASVETMRRALAEGRECRTTLLNYRKDGTPFWNEVFLSPVYDGAGTVTQYVGVQNDVSERRSAEERVEFLAYHDSLTGLGNRALLARHLDRALERARRHGLQVALLYFDLDRFKYVNDSRGHAAGDELLVGVAERLRGVVRASDLLVRQGGDEFLVLLADLEGDAAPVAETVARAIGRALARPFPVGGAEIPTEASIGISVFPVDAHDADALLRHADGAMYRAKREGSAYRLHRSSRRPAPAAAVAAGDLGPALAPGGITPLFQPIVDLDRGVVVGHEALARGPEGPLRTPDALFGTARATGRLPELEWACRTAALTAALGACAGRHAVFVNAEPDTLGLAAPDAVRDLVSRAVAELDVVVEVTERALTARPAELFAAVEALRAAGCRIALDDVGADTRSLALMPLLRPDVIKLDLRLVQEQPTTEIAAIMNAVSAERERTGALVLAEGIETPEHRETALALGAELGQGWLFGRPQPLPPALAVPAGHLPQLATPAAPAGSTPFDVVAATRRIRRADKRLLLSISRNLEQQAGALGETAVVVSAFQEARRFTKDTHRRYTALAADAAFVAALGVGMEPEPAPGVRGAALAPDDRLSGEWSVCVLGPHFAAALVAVDLGDEGPEWARRFDYALTYDRELVIQAAASLMQRVRPLASSI